MRPNYKTFFGLISNVDYSGKDYWFSVDRHGVVRYHSYKSAGFARS